MGRKTEITNLLAHLPRLGAGVGYHRGFGNDLIQQQTHVDFLEIVADDYLGGAVEKMRELEWLTEHFTVIPHATNLSLGSTEGVDPVYLERLAGLIKYLNPPWWSEHIGWTNAAGAHLAQVAPLPRTREALEVFTRNLTTVRRVISAPLILEPIRVDVELPGAEMDEATFITEALGYGGCGLLLDLGATADTADRNGMEPLAHLKQLPLERVVQVHLSEGPSRATAPGGTGAPECAEPLWKLLEHVVEHSALRGVSLDFEVAPATFGEVLWKVDRARTLGRQFRRWN